MRKLSLHILLFVLTVFSTASCIYDYTPQLDGEGGYMVVEGNLIIGQVSNIRTRWSWSLVDTAQGDDQWRILNSCRMHVEASDGSRYDGPYGSFDLREADPSLEYRLVIENERGTYASGWARPTTPGQIDSLSYRISEDGKQMSILVAAQGDGAEGSYYRWTVDETWEYHADVFAIYQYDPMSGQIFSLDYENNLYNCWTNERRVEIMTASTYGLSEDRLADHQLYTLANTDRRVSVLYSAEVSQMRLSEEAYRYWQTMQRNSSDVGGLFSPEPSEVRGNVVNTENPDELVLGYVGVFSVASKRLFVDNSKARFYRNASGPLPAPDTLGKPDEWRKAYNQGMRPAMDVWNEEGNRLLGYEWWPVRCVDCRALGGSKRKPDYWPNRDI